MAAAGSGLPCVPPSAKRQSQDLPQAGNRPPGQCTASGNNFEEYEHKDWEDTHSRTPASDSIQEY